ncbi:DUF6531 domain-containing protein [Porticoccaceae bacterium]|nr:DUF6531 domain-containing protein [Porticoccaceae bacterium]
MKYKYVVTLFLFLFSFNSFSEQQPYPKAKGYGYSLNLYSSGHDLGNALCEYGPSDVFYGTNQTNDFVTIRCYKDNLVTDYFAGSFSWVEICRLPGHDLGEYCQSSFEFDLPKNIGPKCGTGGNGLSPTVGNPIYPLVGNKYQAEFDYKSNSSSLKFVRTYNSRINPEFTTLSSHWTGNYDRRLHFNDPSREGPALSSNVAGSIYRINYLSGGGSYFTPSPHFTSDSLHSSIHVTRPNGGLVRFVKLNGTTTWVNDRDTISELTESTNGWQYYDGKGLYEEYNQDGQLVSIKYHKGRTENIVYDAVANTSTVIDQHSGDSLVFVYDPSEHSRLIQMTDPDNGVYRYAYNPNGMLEYVSYPDNTMAVGSNPFGEDNPYRQYHYEVASLSNALTGITDENGNRFATWAYDINGRAISSTHNGGSDLSTVDYTHINDVTDPRIIATNSLEKETSYHYITIHGVRKISQVQGHQTANCAAANQAYTYDLNGFLASKTDWKGSVTNFTNNTKGQELSRTEAVGTSEARTITTEWHSIFNLPIKITEPEQETIISYDLNGNELSRVIDGTGDT